MVCSTLYCTSQSFDLLKESLPILETTDGLLRGAVAIAAHSFDDVDFARYDRYLNSLSERVVSQVSKNGARTASRTAKLARLHTVLFDEEGFYGNVRQYY